MDKLRPATVEEVQSLLAQGGDIPPGSSVYAFEKPNGTPDFAIARPVVELDLQFVEANPRRRLTLLWGLENIFRALGLTEYRFFMDNSDEAYKNAVRNLGAQQTLDPPDANFRKVL